MLSLKAKPSPESDSLSARMDHLRGVALFGELKENAEALAELAQSMREQVYEPGAAMISEGETGAEMFLLVSGRASVFKSTVEHELYKVAILDGEHHAFFGEGALLDSDARSATIRADTQCHCLVLTREAFERFGARHPDWAFPVLRRIARVVMARFRKTNEDLLLVYNALVTEIRGR